MNHFKTWFATLLLTATLSAQVSPGKSDTPIVKRTAASEEAEGDRPDLRRDFDLLWFGGEPSAQYLDYKKARAQEELERWAHTFPGYKGGLPAIPGASAPWNNLGPKKSTFSVYSGAAPTYPDVDAGRPSVGGILTHPTNPQILYLATSGGGFWKTTNADLTASGDWTWTPLTDSLPNSSSTGNVSIGAVAMSPADPETLFLALGDSFDAAGRGLYKSVNGGTAWSELGAVGTTTRVHALLVLDANTILVAGNAGMWRSTNAGVSFTNLSLGGVTTGDIWSIQRVGSSITNLVATRKSGTTGTFWYSSDGGGNWTQATLDGLASGQNPGRVTVNASLASATKVYAIAENTGTGVFARGVFKSSDAGHNWTYLAAPTITGGLFQPFNQSGDGDQAFYNHCLAVDPDDDSKLFVASNLSLFRSTDGGATWVQMTSWRALNLPYAHADFHTNAWSKSGTKTLFLGNDGGLCVVRDPNRATPPFTADQNVYAAGDVTYIDNRRNRGITSHLVYHVGSSIGASPADTRSRITLGLQDLSSRVRVDEGTGLQNSSTWNDPTGTGDGFGTLINSANGDKMVVSSYNTNLRRSTNGGTTWTSASSGITGTAPFHTQLFPGRTDATGNTLFTSTNLVIYKSTDWAATAWTPLTMTGFTGTLIRNFNTSASNANSLAIAANSGNVWVSSNGGASWTNPAGGDISGGSLNLSYIWFDTTNNQVIYVSSVALGAVSHLWKSVNGGTSFSPIDVSNGFPFGIPVHVIQNDPSAANRLLAGTDFGVYISENGGTTWARYGVGLPMVATRDLYIAPDGSFVRAATFGRGVWEISAPAAPGPTITTQPQSQSVTVGQTATFNVVATGTGTLSYQWKRGVTNVGTNSTSYTTPPTILADSGLQFSVVVTDTAGSTNSSIATLTVNPPSTGPTITTHPANVTVLAGQPATFTVVATGTGTLTYQWRRNAVVIPGATSATYITPPTVTGDNGIPFGVNVTDSNGSTLSNSGFLTVTPCGSAGTNQILQNPDFELGNNGAWVTSTTQSGNFIIDASNSPTNAHGGSWYAWLCGYGSTTTETVYQQVTIAPGATPVTLKFWLRIATGDAGSVANDTLKLQIRNTSGGILETKQTWSNLNSGAYSQKTFDLTSYAGQTIRIYFEGIENSSLFTSFFLDDFELNVTSGSSATTPAITTHPATQNVSPGQPASFSVVASGTPPLYYQWRKDGTVIPTATNSTFSIASAQVGDAGSYTVLVSNCAGFVTSNPATLTVSSGTPPTITTQPQSQTVTAGQSTSFTVVASGSATLTYQWRRNGSNITGATNATYTFTATLADSTAQYSVFVSNSSGNVTSSNATLTVNPKNRDLNGDSQINVLDIATLMAAYSGSGVPTSNPAADLDGDGDCDDADLALLLAGI